MPRLIVSLDDVGKPPSPPFILDEEVDPIHMDDEHASVQLVERIAWAIHEADEFQRKLHAAPRSYLDVPRG